VNWVKKRKLLAIEVIHFNSQSCIKLDDLWNTLHGLFNSTQSQQVNTSLFNEISAKAKQPWYPFSKKELKHAIEKCNNLLAPRPDKLSWRHIKIIIRNKECSSKLINIANACIDLGH